MKALVAAAFLLIAPHPRIDAPPPAPANQGSVRFFGTGPTWSTGGYVDRIRTLVDDGMSGDPVLPANVGGEDFTIEMWLRPTAANDNSAISSGSHILWITCNIFFDRDRWANTIPGRDFGVALCGGRVAFGVDNGSGGQYTLVGSSDLRGSSWHHVAVQRRSSDGQLEIFVDGAREAQVDGPDGTLAYPDGVTIESHCGQFGSSPCTQSDPYSVLGAEKHDAADDLSYIGWMDELRISNVLRYSGTSYVVPSAPFTADANTMVLYHFDEGEGTTVLDSSGNDQHGEMRVGGPNNAPQWSEETPF